MIAVLETHKNHKKMCDDAVNEQFFFTPLFYYYYFYDFGCSQSAMTILKLLTIFISGETTVSKKVIVAVSCSASHSCKALNGCDW